MAQKSKILAPVTIASAGTRQQITASEIAVYSVIFQADDLNTGDIYIGDSTITAANGIELAAGETYVIDAVDVGEREIILSDFWVDTETNNNVLKIQYLTVRGS